MTDATTALIQNLLTDAAIAHGVYEAEVLGGVHDEQWPQWYAAHIARALEARSLTLAPTAAPTNGENHEPA
jgi:hypothetical protein